MYTIFSYRIRDIIEGLFFGLSFIIDKPSFHLGAWNFSGMQFLFCQPNYSVERERGVSLSTQCGNSASPSR
jgi:hypothetical protein